MDETYTISLQRFMMVLVPDPRRVMLCSVKSFIQASQDEAIRQKEALNHEVNRLRGELQQVRDDRDRLLSQVHGLTSEIEKYKESTGKSVAQLDKLMIKSNALEVCQLNSF